jgi:hypothetical protein
VEILGQGHVLVASKRHHHLVRSELRLRLSEERHGELLAPDKLVDLPEVDKSGEVDKLFDRLCK